MGRHMSDFRRRFANSRKRGRKYSYCGDWAINLMTLRSRVLKVRHPHFPRKIPPEIALIKQVF